MELNGSVKSVKVGGSAVNHPIYTMGTLPFSSLPVLMTWKIPDLPDGRGKNEAPQLA